MGFFCIRCAGFLPFNRPLAVMSADELKAKIKSHASKLQTFHGKALVQMQTQSGIMSGSIELLFHRPDSVWLKIEGPMGLDMAVMRMIEKEVFLYSPLENIAYTGSLNDMVLFNQIDLDWEPQQIMMGMLGLLTITLPNDSLNNFQILARHYVFDYNNGFRYYVEPGGPVVSQWEQLNEHRGHVSWVADEFRNKNGVRLPRIISIHKIDTGEKFALSYYYTKANIKLEKNWHEINVPEGVLRIEL